MNAETYRLLELDRLLEVCAQQSASELGRRRILEAVPCRDLDHIRQELSLVAEMVELLAETALPIQGLSDISAALKRVSPPGALLDRRDYLPLKDALLVSGAVQRFFAHQGEKYPRLTSLAGALSDFQPLCAAIEHIFDPSAEIRDDASPELKRLRRRKEAESRHLHELLDSVLKKWAAQKITQEDAPTYREGRLLIPVKAEHRGRISGVVQDESASGATIFVEPLEAISIGNAIRRLEGEESREIHRLLLQLCDQIRAELPAIITSLEVLTQFDSIYARARFSRRLKCVSPKITAEPYTKLIEARHPLLALKEGLNVVPLSLTLGADEGSILVITGPNAGGKTVALKTVGLLCLMAECGLQVPAEEGTELPALSALHCDIGDPQSLEQNLSTFTSHMMRLKSALEDEGRPKLVLLDEIGAGTDPAEGSAIARAALLDLLKQGALAIATTHQGTLKVFAHETPGIYNGSMEFDQETLQPTFRFRPGLPGSSYALEISARVGLAPEILATAKTFLGEEKNRLEDLLARLNESLRLSETARREAEIRRVEMESLRQLYQQRMKELTRSEKERLQKAAQEARELLENVNRRIEAEVKSIREQKASKPAILRAHQAVREEKEKVSAILKASQEAAADEGAEEAAGVQALQVGDWVRLDDLKDAVCILALKKDGHEALLEVGGLHIWMETSRLKRAQPPGGQVAEPAIKVSLAEQPAVTYELDLRGMTGDEAAFALQKYLDDCALSGWKSVRIIHGKGTGALRGRVRDVLEKYPGVKSFRYGRPEEGEFGVTVVELE